MPLCAEQHLVAGNVYGIADEGQLGAASCVKRLTQHSAAYRPKQSSMIHEAASQPTHSTEGAGACIQWAKMSDTSHPSALAQRDAYALEGVTFPQTFQACNGKCMASLFAY